MSAGRASEAAIWHDVECGAYAADLPLWEELAARAGGPVLDLGCGTGRVALHLARRGHDVTGLDREPALVAELNERAEGLPARGLLADARDFALPERDFALAIAPMQLVQLFAGEAERSAFFGCLAAHLRPGGTAAIALVESVAPGVLDEDESVPDSREVDGWLYASLPLELAVEAETITVRRVRKTVSPGGALSREDDVVELRSLRASALEREAVAAGLLVEGRREVAATDDHVGSTVVLARREG